MKEDDGNYLQPGVDLEDSHRLNSERSYRVSFTQTLCIGICLAAVFVTSVAVLASMLSVKAGCPQVRAGCVITCPDQDQRDIGLPLEGPTTVCIGCISVLDTLENQVSHTLRTHKFCF